MSSIYEALKRTQMNPAGVSGHEAASGVHARRTYWIIVGAILISSAATAALIFGLGLAGQSKKEHTEVVRTVRTSSERILDLMNRAERLRGKGELKGAMDAYSRILTISPGSVDVYLKLSDLYYEARLYDKALSTYSMALKITPNDPRLLNNIGSVLLAKGDAEKALGYFIRARRNSGDYVEPLYNMACAYARLKKKDAALSSLRQACSMQPEARLWARRDPDLVSLKGDKDFESIVRAQ